MPALLAGPSVMLLCDRTALHSRAVATANQKRQMGQLMKATWASTALPIQRTEPLQTHIFWRFVRHALSAFALCGSSLVATSAIAQAGLVRWVFDPAISTTAWIAGETISIGYTLTSSGQTDSADLVANLRVKRNDDQAFAQTGNYKVCVGFDGVCSTIIAQFSVVSGQLVANINNATVPPAAFREGRQLWVRRLVGTDPNVEDANVRSAYLDIVPTLPDGSEAAIGCRLDMDGDGAIKLEIDGLILQRYMLGFRGDALFNGLNLANALRPTSDSVESFVSSQNYSLTPIASKATDAALVIARYFGGQRADSLIGGVTNITLLDAKNAIEQRLSYRNGLDQCSLPLIGLRDVYVADTVQGKLSVLVGSSKKKRVALTTLPGYVATDYAISVEGGSTYATIQSDSAGWLLAANPSSLSAGSSSWIRLRITHLPSGLFAMRSYKLEVLAPVLIATGNLTSTGTTLQTSGGGQIAFGPNSLVTPTTVSISEATASDGRRLLRMQYGQSVSGAGVEISFPMPTDLVAANSSGANPTKASSTSAAVAFDASMLLRPYQGDSKKLGGSSVSGEWARRDWFFTNFGDHRIPYGAKISPWDQISLDVTNAEGTQGEVTIARAWELNSTLPALESGQYETGVWEPILFVHGFATSLTTGSLGGGYGTWSEFPTLVQDINSIPGKRFIPFEFRWATDARLVDVARDLSQAINLIHSKTGKSVHLVAHSFGGVLVRTLLQGHAIDQSASSLAAVQAKVATLITLGSPHSGILDMPASVDTNTTAPPTLVALPKGQDSWKHEFCDQISCHVMGEDIFLIRSDAANAALQRVFGLTEKPGQHAALLATSTAKLPAIQMVVGIGLTADNYNWRDGDQLISYQGQRLPPGGNSLLKDSTVGAARVWEVILGSRASIKPGDPRGDAWKSATERLLGYTHTGGNDSILYGSEAAAEHSDCKGANALQTCRHAGWLLFKNLQQGRYCEFTEAGCGTPVFDVIPTFAAVKDVGTTFTVTGQSLAPGYTFAFPGCVATEVSSTSTTSRQYRCTPTQAGTLAGSLTFQGTTLKTFNVTVTAPQATISGSKLAAGAYHTCARGSDGVVKCWGKNDNGQLGDDTSTNSQLPVAVQNLPGDVVSLALGQGHSCALNATGAVYCWGWNGYGQLGNGTQTSSPTATPVNGLSSGVLAIATGAAHTCALLAGGSVRCWGWNVYGALGDGAFDNRSEPYAVSGVQSAVGLVAGNFHTCALISGGAVKCWGYNAYGSLGDNSTSTSPLPVAVSSLSSGVASLAAGGDHTCAVGTDSSLKCWGYNFYGQLGDTSTTDRLVPVSVDGLSSNVQSVSVGGTHSCALLTAGAVRCWGQTITGRVSDPVQVTPLPVAGLTSAAVAAAAGGFHSCVTVASGGVKCWGYNGLGQLGNGTGNDSAGPVDVVGFTGSLP